MYRNRKSGAPLLPGLLLVVVLAAGGLMLALRSASPEPASEAASPAPTAEPTPVPTPTATPADPADTLYQLVYDQVDGMQQEVTFTEEALTREEVQEVLDKILHRPEFFWLDNYYCSITGNTYQLQYTWKYDDAETCRAQVEEAASQALASIPEGAGDYEKSLALHNWLCDHIVYQLSSDNSDQDLYGALALGRCVCAGYCAAYEYLLDQVGISAETIHGQADGGNGASPHAWTKLVLDGEVYYTDLTWDDEENYPNGHTYAWFAVTSDQMASTHFADPEESAAMTPSSAVGCNYYYRNGFVLDSFSTDSLAQIYSSQTDAPLTVLATDETVYQQLVALLQDGNATTDLLEQSGHPAASYLYYIVPGTFCVDLFPKG